ncbi:MAG: YlxP-like protein [Clostridiales bacterium 38_11]|nr:MAG: YlxP-like protein [Clostridiales bacterium 38_11]HBH13154.1 DUF503 domain-containing protein [Clostridiales bacterium]
MIVMACEIELLIYESNSLKDKRQVIKSIINRLRERYNISVSETDYLDKWNRSKIAAVTVSNSLVFGEQVIDKIIGFVNKDTRVEIIGVERNVY